MKGQGFGGWAKEMEGEARGRGEEVSEPSVIVRESLGTRCGGQRRKEEEEKEEWGEE